jgi:hypothetical protein
MKDPRLVIGQMNQIRQTYGVDSFNLIHDNFTARRDEVFEFCEALIESGEKFKWSCYARTDCLSEELLELMERAGCTGIFLGIETGSARLQQAIGKKLDLDQALEAIRWVENRRVSSTVSLITGFPDETIEDLRSTVGFLIDVLRFDHVIGQLYLLTPAAGSPLYDQYRQDLVWDGIFSEVTIQNWRQDSEDYALIREYPEVFPDFYAIPTPWLDRHYLAELRHFILYGIARFRWLIIALHQHSGDLLEVFELWRVWYAKHRVARRMDAEYCGSTAFRSDFLKFVGSAYLKENDADGLAVATLLECEIALDHLGEHSGVLAMSSVAGTKPLANIRTVPRLAPGVAILSLRANYQSIIEHLKSRKSPRDVPLHPVAIALRPSIDRAGDVLQLSPLSSALIGLCNGERSVAEIAQSFPELEEGLEELPKDAACLYALNELVRQGLITAAA